MEKSFIEITRHISANLNPLRKDLPEAISALAQNAMRPGALDKKTKELIALALGVAGHCDPCIGFHVEALINLNATRLEIEEALGVAVYMGGGPSLMYAAEALAAYDEFFAQKNAA